MGRHRISQSALSKASSIRPATIHMLYHAKTESVSLAVLASILDGLRKLTGVAYEVSDILSIAFLPDSGALMDAQKYAPQGKA